MKGKGRGGMKIEIKGKEKRKNGQKESKRMEWIERKKEDERKGKERRERRELKERKGNYMKGRE